MARDIYAHVPPFGEAKVWSEEQLEKEAMAQKMEKKGLLINAGAQEIQERTVVVKQVKLNGWYTREELIKIAAMKEMQP